jgi:small subunit ribosomal protein S15
MFLENMMVRDNIAKDKPVWFKRSKEEVEALIIKLAKQGLTAEKIGLVLRDSYGTPSVRLVTDKISRVIAKNMAYTPSDLLNLEKKAERLRKTIEKNKQDKVAKRSLQITEAKIKKLKKYYIRKKIIK